MARVTWLLAGTTVLGIASSLWLFLDNRALRAAHDPAPAPPPPVAEAAARTPDPWLSPARATTRSATVPPPALPEAPAESRLERRARHTDEIAAMFGRGDGESEADYRARIMPLIKAGLAGARSHADEMRKEAEAKAHVTPDQSARLDKAFDKVYADVLDYTNKAIGDGQLSPYERNVAGWLEYAGGLGGILDETQGQIAKILDPGQVAAMSASGFEWGEYLGLEAPWEQLSPPPPRPAR